MPHDRHTKNQFSLNQKSSPLSFKDLLGASDKIDEEMSATLNAAKRHQRDERVTGVNPGHALDGLSWQNATGQFTLQTVPFGPVVAAASPNAAATFDPRKLPAANSACALANALVASFKNIHGGGVQAGSSILKALQPRSKASMLKFSAIMQQFNHETPLISSQRVVDQFDALRRSFKSKS